MTAGGAQTILIIDDDSELLTLFRTEMENDYQILTAGDGEEGLILALVHKPDLIISDVNMPNLNGWELCYILRQIPSTRAIPFVFLTCRTDLPDKVKSLAVGADDFVAKPFSIGEISERMRLLAGRMRNRKRLIDGSPVFDVELNTLLLDLLEFLRITRRSGVIEYSRMRFQGQITLRSGMIVEAVFDTMTGEEALRTMMQSGPGEVVFKEKPISQTGPPVVDWDLFVASLFPPE